MIINCRTNPTESDIVGNYEHIEVDFADDRSQYFVKIYYAERFHMLRKLLFVEGEDCFIRSLSVSTKWNPQGGKSGASFYQTHVSSCLQSFFGCVFRSSLGL
ncbi:unnamed protein product [Anisakis simplex]|uniref:1-phosphatidylinositol 3-phosphate 5-kinase (inferred by orthology to a human protein) n=1 Tax=Anisakis simplex TaxID=6269 RepID=A0A0M3JJT1_ANISI|nr:unnamed protein product [Anisakis simplex]